MAMRCPPGLYPTGSDTIERARKRMAEEKRLAQAEANAKKERYNIIKKDYQQNLQRYQFVKQLSKNAPLIQKYYASQKVSIYRILKELEFDPQKIIDDLSAWPQNIDIHSSFASSEECYEYCMNALQKIEKDEEEYFDMTLNGFDGFVRTASDAISERLEIKTEVEQDGDFDLGDLLSESITAIKKSVEILNNDRKNKAVSDAGRQGEVSVEYALKWMQPQGYRSVWRTSLTKYGMPGIVLKNRAFIDEQQELDHIIVGTNGVFLIETKNYSGTLQITRNGDWIQEKNNIKKGIKNPVQQCNRHHAVLQSILEKNVPITSIICIANEGVIVEGRQYCQIPLVRVELLQDLIESTPVSHKLSKDDINQTLKTIYRYMVSEELLWDRPPIPEVSDIE